MLFLISSLRSDQFSSRWRLHARGKPVCAPPSLTEVSPAFPLKWFQGSFDWWWPLLVLSTITAEHFLSPLSSRISSAWSLSHFQTWCRREGLPPGVCVESRLYRLRVPEVGGDNVLRGPGAAHPAWHGEENVRHQEHLPLQVQWEWHWAGGV